MRQRLPKLIPSVKLKSHRSFESDFDNKYSEMRLKILEYYKYTCQYCSFKSKPKSQAQRHTYEASGYLEIHHINDDHQDNSFDNLIPVCPFCHQVFNIGFAGARFNFIIIQLPWISQQNLNLLTNVLGVAKHRGGDLGAEADILYERLINLNSKAVQEFGHGVSKSNSSLIGPTLTKLYFEDKRLYAKRNIAFRNIRFLPNLDNFSNAVSYWSDHCWPDGEDWEQQWQKIFDQTINKILKKK